jgi:hypothetical protein
MSTRRLARALPLLAVLALSSGFAAPEKRPLLVSVSGAVSEAELKATITQLVSYGTRHTLSDTASPTRGIGAARRWAGERFAAISKACGGCLEIVTPEERFTGDRMPKEGAVVQDVIAVQRGTTDPDRVIVISGHIDTRNSTAMDATGDAPGANDDGSGTAAVLEAARVLSQHKFPATLVFAVLSGEEEGLYGGKVEAHYAREHGWQVEAVLNNDIVGNTHGQNGAYVPDRVRVFSEGTKAVETPQDGARRRYSGGEVDSPSRNLARFIDELTPLYVPGFRAQMIYRTDRFGRGGDQTPMLEAGFPAVRITEAAENWTRQHQDLRPGFGDVIEGVDFPYLARVTRMNVVALAALAMAPAPPEGIKIDGALSDDTTVTWRPSKDAARYRVWWRDTLSPRWEHSQDATGEKAVIKDVVIDDWFFGVQAVSADGWASPIAFPGPPGSFISPPPAGPLPPSR